MRNSSQPLISDFSLHGKSISTLLITLCGICLYTYKYTSTITFTLQLLFLNFQSHKGIERMKTFTEIYQFLTGKLLCLF